MAQVKAQKWAVMRMYRNGWRKVGVIRYTGDEPERLAVRMYGRNIALVLMDKTFDRYYK